MSETLTGKTIGKFKIIERIGKGGMAEVYKGYQENLHRYAAIKVMHSFLTGDDGFLIRFKQEARTIAGLRHDNIVRLYDFDVYGEDSYYLVMEYISGGTLKERLDELAAKGEQLSLQESVRLIIEVGSALAYAHRRQMVHRDIKPANIMLDENNRAILTDFGIVKLLGDQSTSAYTATGAMIGTPAYMSPEQALGKSGDARVDIYALGVLLFQLVTNQLPFAAETPIAVVMKHVNEPPPLPMTFYPDIPLDLQEIILRALAKNPDDRFQTAQEMVDALRAVNFSGAKASAGMMPATMPSSPTLTTPVVDEGTAAGVTKETMQPEPELEETGTAVTAAPPKKRSPWLYVGISVVALIVVTAILAVSGVFSSPEPTNTPIAVVVPPTEAASETPEPEETALPTETPLSQLDAFRTVSAEDAMTAQALATETPTKTATPTKTPTATPTIDLTAQFSSNCTTDVELVSVDRSGSTTNAVTIGFRFHLEWILQNTGTCTWPAGLIWEYVEDDDLGEYETFELEEPVLVDEEVEIRVELGPIESPGTYTSVWQLMEEDGETPFGPPISFDVRAFDLATAVSPTATTAPVPTSGSGSGSASGTVDWIYTVSSCEYLGDDLNWRCQVTITPYIDGNDQVGNYTVFVFDGPGGQATTYRGTGPHFHFVSARRCAVYNQGVRVIDDLTGTEISEPLYVDPNIYFAGGCTEN